VPAHRCSSSGDRPARQGDQSDRDEDTGFRPVHRPVRVNQADEDDRINQDSPELAGDEATMDYAADYAEPEQQPDSRPRQVKKGVARERERREWTVRIVDVVQCLIDSSDTVSDNRRFLRVE